METEGWDALALWAPKRARSRTGVQIAQFKELTTSIFTRDT